METNESNIKPHQTGGLKLMTVFVVVLTLHVVVIGGIAAYYMLKGGNGDVDLTDKTQKSVKITPDGTIVGDAPASDSTQGDKTASTAAPADNTTTATTIPATEPAPAPQTENTPTTTTIVSAPSTPAPTAATSTGPVISPATPPVAAPAAPVVASAPEVTTPSMPIDGTPYVVKAHDSLARIAHQNHVSVAKLKAANSLTSDLLHIGQKLVIPAKSQVASATKTDLTGTPTMLAETKTTITPVTPAPMATTPDLATAGHHVYTVVKGDTLTKIAHRFKTTSKAIMAANSLTDAAKLSIGEKLKIPSKESRSATIAPAPTPTQPREVQAKPATTAQPSDVQAKPVTTAQLVNFVQ